MWLLFFQVPITWLNYKLGISPITTTDGLILFYLWLWNMEPLIDSHLSKNLPNLGKLFFSGVLSFLLYIAVAIPWASEVNVAVPQPYLDEVFHIPQAQAYCKGRWGAWDDKITTPPGLYLIAVLYHKIVGYTVCTAASLRHVNLVGIFLVHHLALYCRKYIEITPNPLRLIRLGTSKFVVYTQPVVGRAASVSFFNNHTALNITAFPVLFFFSGLFYTDVWSTVSVLLVYLVHLWRMTRIDQSIWSGLLVIVLGVASLLMRQTNVFWVAVYFGGLEAVHAIGCLARRTRGQQPWNVPPAARDLVTLSKQTWHYWSSGLIHDQVLCEAGLSDWVLCGLSIAVAIMTNPLCILGQIWPYVSIVGLFASFVGWNEGVVLGDKSNHVATLHSAQMLYIWPLFAFFSAPLLISPVLSWALNPHRTRLFRPVLMDWVTHSLKGRSVNPQPATDKALESTRRSKTSAHQAFDLFSSTLFNPLCLLGSTLLCVAIVKYNTIIHPFTLADNRHYMFYVFRYTIRRSQLIRYGLIPVYMISASLVWCRLAGLASENYKPMPGSKPAQGSGDPGPSSRNVEPSSLTAKTTAMPGSEPAQGSGVADASKPTPNTTGMPVNGPPPLTLIDLSHPSSTATRSPHTSTALLWLATTSLSLMTAPLVEPRYFILPWVFWRLLVPAWPIRLPPARYGRVVSWLAGMARRYDLSLLLETVWFVAVNWVTFKIFLGRPYVWRAEDGTVLDGGRTQRFMW